MDGKADAEQTEQFFRYIHANVSADQWDELCRIMHEEIHSGVHLMFSDVIAILESVVVSSDSSVTAEDLLRLAAEE